MRRLVTRAVAAILVMSTAQWPRKDSVTTTQDARSLRYLALGDSYTIGEGVAAHERWPTLLARALEKSGFALVEVQIVARTGWTTSDLNDAIDDAGPRGPFDVVSLLIGSNNQFREHYIGEYRMEFVGLLDRAIGFASGDPSRVIVVSIPDWGVTPFGASYEPEKVAAEIDAFNAVGEEAAERAGANWVDVTAISRRTDPGLVDDKLHPSGVQYEVWVEVILPMALTALGADDVH